jgi:hypothetical protein
MKKGVFIILISCMFLSTVIAQLSISDSEEIYNLGDKIYVSLEGIVGEDSGNLNIDLYCEDTSTNLLRISARAFPQNKESSYELPFKILTKEDLEIENLTNILGECHLASSLNSLSVIGQDFRISNKITLNVEIDKTNYNPGETILIQTNSTKENGDGYFGEITLLNNTFSNSAVSVPGALEIEIPKHMSPGNYILSLMAEDEFGNKGLAKEEIIINQIPSEIGFGVNSFEIVPGNNLSLSLEVKDQIGENILLSLTVKIKSPEKIISEIVLNSGEVSRIPFAPNSSYGKWILTTSLEDLEEQIEINVQQAPLLEYSLNGDILIIRNIGNYVYEDYFEISIGDSLQEIFLRLDKNEIREFQITAPEGEYSILLEDSQTSFEGSSFLTGKAISLEPLSSKGNFYQNYLWLLLILTLGVVGVILIKKNPKTKKVNPIGFNKLAEKAKGKTQKTYLKKVVQTINFTNKSPEVQSIDSSNYHSSDKTMKDLTTSNIMSAESSLVLSGEKVKSSVLILKIKNYSELKEYAREELEKMISSEKNKKVLIDKRENYIFFIFSPNFTRTYKNEILAARYGFNLMKSLKAFNKKFKNKIEFNMGINDGDLVISKTDGKIKYTALGKIISQAKRLSDSTNSKLIIPDDIRRKLIRDLKVEKSSTINEKQVFSVLSITDKQANQEKLKEILKRM